MAAAHQRRLRVAAEVRTLAAWHAAVDAGADILVGQADGDLDEATVQQMAKRGTAYVPALFAVEARRQVLEHRVHLDPFERACSPGASLESLEAFSLSPPDAPQAATDASGRPASPNIRRLLNAGVTIAAGSSAGDARALPGPALHRELELMVDAGLSPAQALASATRQGARLVGREHDLGQLQPGMRADVVLLDADPLADIRNTHRVVTVIRGGALYER